MRRQMQVNVRRKPKKWSIGIFVAAGLWIFGDSVWGLGTNPWWLVGTLVISYMVDSACTGNTSTDGVYID